MSSLRRWSLGLCLGLVLTILIFNAQFTRAATPSGTTTKDAISKGKSEANFTTTTPKATVSKAAIPSITAAAAAAAILNPNEPRCRPFEPIKHGAISYRNATDVTPLLATFSCALGTELNGNATSSCRRSGQWSHEPPTCDSIGVRAYADRSGLASIGIISLHDESILVGLSEAAQRAHGAVGFQIRLKGKHKAFLLQEHSSLTKLTPSDAHNVYVFGPGGTLKRYLGMKASKDARLQAVDFSTDSSVLKGLRHATALKRKQNDNIIGFSIAHGHSFRASLLGWASLPLKPSKSRHSFILRDEIEKQVTELGCFKASPQGESALRASTVMPLPTTIKSARLVCAAIAREKSHRFFAISGRNCTSGNSNPGKYGRAAYHDEKGNVKFSCAMSAATAVKLGVTSKDAPLLLGAGAQPGFFHTFQLDQSVLRVPEMINGGFEEDQYLTPYDKSAKDAVLTGKQSLAITPKTPLHSWSVDTTEGEVGLAAVGSAQLVNHTAFEGQQSLYFENGGSITQTLRGLVQGRQYTLRFAETFRKDQQAGMTLRVSLGEQYVIYQNPYVSIPLWTKRRINFKAPSSSVNLTFTASSDSLPGYRYNFRTASTILLDAVSVAPRSFAGVKEGMIGSLTHGRVASFDASHAEMIKAFKQVSLDQASAGGGGVGVRIQANAAVTIGKNDLATLDTFIGGVIYLNNGTVLTDVTTRTHSGFISMRHPILLEAMGRISKMLSNSIAFSVRQDPRAGVEVVVLSNAAMPLHKDERYTTYFFDTGITDLGCWEQPSNGHVLSTIQHIKGQPVNRLSCAEAAAKAEHDYFALQTPTEGRPICMTGRSDITDKTDDVYYAGGRSAGCSMRCAHGKGNCGGRTAANVFRLPLYSRVSRNGHASTDDLHLSSAQRRAAQDIFDRPGQAYFSSITPNDHRAVREAEQSQTHAESLGFASVLYDAPKLTWAHALQYHFGGTQEYAVTKYVIQAPALTEHHPATPAAWTFEGSKDGITWVVLDVQTHIAFYTGQKRSFKLRNQRAFHFHRLVVTENGGVGVPGFGIQGLTLYARREKVRFLKSLYRFEDPANMGWDSSYKNNDLQAYGGVYNGTIANLLSVFNVTQEANEVKIGKGSLKISNAAGTLPSYLAVDQSLKMPAGLPVRDRSFGIAFWFKVNSTVDDVDRFSSNVDARPDQFTIMTWGDQRGDASSNTIALDADFRAIRNSFGVADHVGLGSPESLTFTDTLQDEWHHYAVSYDAVSGAHRVWLDTKLVASRFYQNPAFSVTPERFLIGASILPTETGRPGSDEFNGLLDDIAIFNGPLSTAVIKDIATGNFVSYMPLGCQGMSNEFNIEAGVTWGRATDLIKERYLRNKCYTKPASCQTLSDQYHMNPMSPGRAGYYARKQYTRSHCATWPSILSKQETFASCPPDQTITIHNVFTREAALSQCNLHGLECQAYVWGGVKGDQRYGIKAFELRLCKAYLSELKHAPGLHITTRVSKYLLHPDSKIKCDSHSLPTHNSVPTSIHARWLCDSTPGCVGYVWSGKVGPHSNGRPATPGRLTLCANMRKGQVFSYPKSGYEVGFKLGAYIVMADRTSKCSAVSSIGTITNITSSLQARRECDRLDGKMGAPKCQSYAWDKNHREAHLCSSVPQSNITFAEDIETGLIMPSSCQQMSDFFDIMHGESWGFAPFEVRQMFHSQNCTTAPRSCQVLSDTYSLSPNVTDEIAITVPGEARDLWLRQECKSFPTVTESEYFISSTYQDLQRQIDTLKSKIDSLDGRILRLAKSNNPAITTREREALQESLAQAKLLIQSQLDTLKLKQEAELSPILQRAAESQATLDQTKQIHNIIQGLLKSSIRT